MIDLAPLADAVPALEAAMADPDRIAQYVPACVRGDGVIQLGHYRYTGLDAIWDSFRAAGYDPAAQLDYVGWQAGFDGDPDAPSAIARMTVVDLTALLVRFSRGERFCDGYWHGLIARGSLLAAARRILVLGSGR